MKDIVSVASYTRKDATGKEIHCMKVTTHPSNKYSKVYMDKRNAIERGKDERH